MRKSQRIAIVTILLGPVSCGDAGGTLSRDLERQLTVLEAESDITAARADCETALTRRNAADDAMRALQNSCVLAMAASASAADTVAANVTSTVISDWSRDLALEAAQAGDASAWVVAATIMSSQAGGESLPFKQLNLDSFSAATSAATRAVEHGVPEAHALLARLEAIEFPMAGVAPEDLWKAVYFRRYDELPDDVLTRRMVIGFSRALIENCLAWEPPGLKSVFFSAKLDIYAAPLSARVPGRLIRSVPQMAADLRRGFTDIGSGTENQGVAGALSGMFSTYHSLRADVMNALATGSTTGRDAAIEFYNEVGSCRSVRGLRMVRSLTMLFDARRNALPTDAALVVATQPKAED